MAATEYSTSSNPYPTDIPKPNFIIIGSAKCGTTTLADILDSHPDCCFSRPKEVNFFNIDSNHTKGWEFYSSAFRHYVSESMVGEATPNYAALPSQPNCAERIYSFNPDMKIIYIVRHPYKKIVSSWKMHCHETPHPAHEAANIGFEYYIKYTQEHFNYLDHCLFSYQINAYKKLFPIENIKIIFLEDWSKNSTIEAAKLMDFLGLDVSRLPSFDPSGSNRAEARKESTKLFQFINQSTPLKVIAKLLPGGIKQTILNSSIAFKPSSYPPLSISSSYKQAVIDYLKYDAQNFLKDHGKPDSFWDFHTDNL